MDIKNIQLLKKICVKHFFKNIHYVTGIVKSTRHNYPEILTEVLSFVGKAKILLKNSFNVSTLYALRYHATSLKKINI